MVITIIIKDDNGKQIKSEDFNGQPNENWEETYYQIGCKVCHFQITALFVFLYQLWQAVLPVPLTHLIQSCAFLFRDISMQLKKPSDVGIKEKLIRNLTRAG